MDQIVDGRFERLEKALANLIDSVTKYHPSVSQAEELSAADAQLSEVLEQVQTHQNNHIRIQQLRNESALLDAQIRDTLTTLASTRRDIVATPVTKFSQSPNYPIAYEELLSYARRISKTTMPPAAALVSPASGANAASPTSTPDMQTPGPTDAPPQLAVTPAAPTPSGSQSPVANGAVSALPAPDQQPAHQQLVLLQNPHQPSSGQNTNLPEGMSQYLNPLSGQLFFPWPSEDKIRSGSLASNQMLVEQGIDPKGYDPATEEERKRKEEEERVAKEEREKAEREQREQQMREERERARIERERQRELEQESWRRASLAQGLPMEPASAPHKPASSSASGEKKQFQFASLDDLDDDDD